MSISPTILSTLAIFSIIMFVVSLILIPVIITRLSSDYFKDEKRVVTQKSQQTLFSFLKQAAKNVLGIVFILAGIVMLILPGQGVLTILIGLGITNFPGKYKLERKLVKNKKIFKSLNWIRKRAGATPFLYPE